MDVFQLFLTNFLFLFVISRIFWQNYSFEAKSFGILSLIRIGRLSSEPYTFAVAGTAKKRSIYSQKFFIYSNHRRLLHINDGYFLFIVLPPYFQRT
ncbi:hypothetical protein D921_01502 [Enterococcus faecalis F01966]|nr:hypothetical protein D921_01502 [Enterococcus faecalis F01966]